MTTNALPADILEVRAAEQRRQIHSTVQDLKSTVRDQLDVKSRAREYLVPASAVIGVVGLVLGYGFAGMFTER
jgi:hypothetical protein